MCRMEERLNGEPLQEVDCFKYFVCQRLEDVKWQRMEDEKGRL